MSPKDLPPDDDTSERFSLIEMDLDRAPAPTRTTPRPIGFQPTMRQPIATVVTPVASLVSAPVVAAIDSVARQAASNRAAAVAARAASNVVPVAPITPPTRPWETCDEEPINAPARDLATREHEVAKEFGLAKGEIDEGLFYTAGTKLWDVGDSNLKAYEAEYKALPTLAQAAITHTATLAAEQRMDRVVALSDYRLDAQGKLRAVKVEPNGALTYMPQVSAISQQAYTQIQAYYPHDRGLLRGVAEARSGAASEETKAKRAAWPSDKPLPAQPSNLNGWLGDLAGVKDGKGQTVQHRLRTRNNRGQREVFAAFATSKRGYVPYDTDKLLAEAARLQPGLRVDLTYDSDTTKMRARCVAQAPIDIPAFNGVGRVHRIGFDLRSADDGSMSLQVAPFLIRIRCKNASLVRTEGKKRRFRHVGTFKTLEQDLQTAISDASKAIDAMRHLWAHAAAHEYLDSESGASLSVHEAIVRLVANESLPTGGLDPEEAVANYMHAWRAEDSPHSAQGVIMAVQRAAHEGSWRTSWADDEIEEAATNLLYQRVYVLDAPEDSAEA